MSTAIDGRVDVDTVEDVSHDDIDRFSHYYKKSDIEKVFFEGKKIRALCGKWDTPTRDFSKYKLCPTCKEIWDQIPNGE